MKPKKFIIKRITEGGLVQEHLVTVDLEDAYLLRNYIWAVHFSRKNNQGELYWYVARRIDKIWEYLHQRVLGVTSGERIYHINHDTLDCRKANLMRESQRIVELP